MGVADNQGMRVSHGLRLGKGKLPVCGLTLEDTAEIVNHFRKVHIVTEHVHSNHVGMAAAVVEWEVIVLPKFISACGLSQQGRGEEESGSEKSHLGAHTQCWFSSVIGVKVLGKSVVLSMDRGS